MADSKPLLSLDGDPAAAEALLQDVFGIVVDEVIRKGTSASEKVCEWKEPEELKQLLDLELRSEGESQEQILERCRAVIRYSVKTCGSWVPEGGVSGIHPQLHPEPPARFSRSPSFLQPALLRVGSPCPSWAHCHREPQHQPVHV